MGVDPTEQLQGTKRNYLRRNLTFVLLLILAIGLLCVGVISKTVEDQGLDYEWNLEPAERPESHPLPAGDLDRG